MVPPPEKNGPDASSLKPVSSLRAKFENMGKPNEVAQAPPPRANSPAPAPKPDKLRESKPPAPKELHPPPIEPKSKPAFPPQSQSQFVLAVGLQPPATPSTSQSPPPRTSSRLPVSPISPQPVKPPSVLVQPPQSPPKGRINATGGDQPSFLNPDSLANTPTSPLPSARNFNIPSRPHSPGTESRSSPKPAGSRPPSPPPPRRSGEIRRTQDAKPQPPPVNRAEKPNYNARHSLFFTQPGQVPPHQEQLDKLSPFNSPPGSGSSSYSDEPPPMPARPRQKADPLPRSNTFHGSSFEPPPLHPSVANRRKEQETSDHGRRMSPQVTGESRPPLPARVTTGLEPPPLTRSGPHSPGAPPPRPPRPAPQSRPVGGMPVVDPVLSTPPKRVVSTPSSQQPQQQQLPSRPHGRSMTIDHTSDGALRNLQAPQGRPHPALREEARPETVVSTALPDISSINRREPYIKTGCHQIPTGQETRAVDVCAQHVGTTTINLTRIWSLVDGEVLAVIDHNEYNLPRGSAIRFKPAADVNDEGNRVWVGFSTGVLAEFDVATRSMVSRNTSAHTRETAVSSRREPRAGGPEIVKIHRHYNELWTLDTYGTLQVWGPDSTGVPNLDNQPHLTRWPGDSHTFSMVVDDELWYCTGKTVGVCLPTLDPQKSMQWIVQYMVQDSAGEICAGTTLKSHPKKVFFGHADGKVSIYSRRDHYCVAVLNVSPYKINSLAGAGDYLWAAYSSGRICAYDIDPSPWVVKKEWAAHDEPVVKLISDPSSFFTFDQCRVISLSWDGVIRAWDGLLQEDWLEDQMRENESKYCEFEKIKALVMTWNAGASTPYSLNQDPRDARFFHDLLTNSDPPDILVFGFQELVDLEDKSAAAKRWMKLGSKKSKKTETAQERMSHQYRDWKDFLLKCLDDYLPDSLYHLLHCATMVGLFTCIFVKSTLRDKITNLSTSQVKRGLGGLDGNKGAIIIRFLVNNSSLCFINCHLAAGQGQANDRHKDVAKIMDAQVLTREPSPDARINNYVSGGDGTMIMDHEICLLNGDLNYRIDTMSRDTVVIAVKQNNLQKLLERDQLLVTRRRNNAFKLRAFEELPITFAPTYKYDVGTDNYDSSEKKRSPAWCDRLLFRSQGKVRQLDYGRHEVRVSDHRPVTGRFAFKIKTISPRERASAWIEAQQQFEDLKSRESRGEKLYYLTRVIGYDNDMAKKILGDQDKRRMHRSPSRNRS
ncbi:hypothetical protein MKZ38_004082 [Zalerion maritima]|uniref:Inositol polyphosphate-related phosphatase domain-containing protein n=1 Tax=Zalerion maritima TaxID=339359 RepID=A0AAD5RYP7_9PEZI|nr:hypothetical protein MKZ38_004082 [Zalerion maritima]